MPQTFNSAEDHKLYISDNESKIMRFLLSKAGQYIETLIFLRGLDKCADALSIIAQYCNNIRRIRLYDIGELDAEGFSRLVESNARLHSISRWCVPKSMEILPLKDWKSLDIGWPNESERVRWEDRAIALIERSLSLENFRAFNWTPRISTAISNCEQLKKINFPIHHRIVVDSLMSNNSLLDRLTCLEVKINERNDDHIMVSLLKCCVNLEHLYLNLAYRELPHAVEEAVLDHKKLESLQLNIPRLTDATLSGLLKFKHLRLHNNLGFITEDGIFNMIKNSEWLEKLEIPNTIVPMDFFERLAQTIRQQNIRQRRKILKITVNARIYEKALAICEGSGILITTELDSLESDIENWLS